MVELPVKRMELLVEPGLGSASLWNFGTNDLSPLSPLDSRSAGRHWVANKSSV
jgi:hypothetical protein